MDLIVDKHTTLLAELETFFAGASRATLRKKLSQKLILVNEKPVVNAQHQLVPGDLVQCVKPERTLSGNIPILYEDNEVIVVVKPEGLLSVDTQKDINSLHRRIKRHVKAPIVYPVHRLDRDTSGLIVFALTTEARDSLKEQLQHRTMKRCYHAVVDGKMKEKKGTVTVRVLENKDLTMRIVERDGKEAITHYRVIKEYRNTSLLECRLETGKKHQIRISLSHLGHPILGDTQYGAPEGPKRMMLHAYKLSFTHPSTGKPFTFEHKIALV